MFNGSKGRRWAMTALLILVTGAAGYVARRVPEVPGILVAYGRYAATWIGLTDIIYVDECTLEASMLALQNQVGGDWTLWYRQDVQARLVAVKVRGQILRFDHDLIARMMGG